MDAITELVTKANANKGNVLRAGPKSTQGEKSSTGMAGEYFVAAELQRRGITASITYGNAKSADILALNLNSNRFLRLEVKTTRRDKGSALVGSGTFEKVQALSTSTDLIWVICVLPRSGDEESSPEYFVFTSEELKSLVLQEWTKYETKRGAAFTNVGMWTLPLSVLEESGASGAWFKIKNRLAEL